MRVGNRFCGHCGHALRADGRFCGNCGRVVPARPGPASAGQSSTPPGRQNLAGAPQQATDPPTIAASRAAGQPVAGTGSDTGSGWAGVPPGSAGRPAYLVPLAAVLALFVVGGVSAAVVVLIPHSHGHAAVREKLAASSPTATPPASVGPSPAPAPPAQVTEDGMTISIGAVNTDRDATAVAATLGNYFGGIDAKNYRQAWDTYSAALRAAIPLPPLATALSTTEDNLVVVRSIEHDGNGNVEADVAFQSHQAGRLGPDPGETCTNWSLDYHLIPAADEAGSPVSLSYVINQVTDIGAGHASC
jgi:hypothetical protein